MKFAFYPDYYQLCDKLLTWIWDMLQVLSNFFYQDTNFLDSKTPILDLEELFKIAKCSNPIFPKILKILKTFCNFLVFWAT